MYDKIIATLNSIDAKVLFAVESGSRAWGFESTNSDYDIRFIYQQPPRHYLTVNRGRDVIENADIMLKLDPLLDCSGWDLQKFFHLVNKSNPICFEWLNSTIIYQEDPNWAYIREAVKPFFSPKHAMHHYLSMARHNYREHMRDGASPNVKLKKYLYICRPLLCCLCIERRTEDGPPPMQFMDVLNGALPEEEVAFELLALVAAKKEGKELDEGPAMPVINEFIDRQLRRLPGVANSLPGSTGDIRHLDAIFNSMVCADIATRW